MDADIEMDSPFAPVADDPSLPRVLLIGDSISIGYTVPVRRRLKGLANVHRIPVNGQFSEYGLANLKEWLGDGRWDVIHFNWGIWDTHILDETGAIVPGLDEASSSGHVRTTIAEYQSNLNRIIDILEPTGARLIWASTTPVTQRPPERLNAIPDYNRAAADVMALRTIPIDDLCGHVTGRLDELQCEDGAHFTDDGYEALGEQVAARIREALPVRLGASEAPCCPERIGEETMSGRRVVRFEHDCLSEWGYEEALRQYFYVVEPEKAGNGPMLVCLHSAGGNPDKFENGRLELQGNVDRVVEAGPDFTGLVLNCGVGADWFWGAEAIKANPEAYVSTLTPVEARVLATVEWAAREYRIDRDRIYLTGISMGGTGSLGIGMSHGDVFAALRVGVPAGTAHSRFRMANSETVIARSGAAFDIPPVVAFFSQKDEWSKEMEDWLRVAREERLQAVTAWGPWGHENHYEMTDPAAFEFPWLSIRRNQAYPSFTNTSSDSRYPGFMGDGPDQNGQSNAYLRWTVIDDIATGFAVELRLAQSGELDGAVEIPAEVSTDVTPRRLQRLRVVAGEEYRWRIEQAGRLAGEGTVTADERGLLTIPLVRVSAKPIVLRIGI